jgi:hypothetical protein
MNHGTANKTPDQARWAELERRLQGLERDQRQIPSRWPMVKGFKTAMVRVRWDFRETDGVTQTIVDMCEGEVVSSSDSGTGQLVWIDGLSSVGAFPPTTFGNVSYLCCELGSFTRGAVTRPLYVIMAMAYGASPFTAGTAATQLEVTSATYTTQVKVLNAAGAAIQTTIGGAAGNNQFILDYMKLDGYLGGGGAGTIGDRYQWADNVLRGKFATPDLSAFVRVRWNFSTAAADLCEGELLSSIGGVTGQTVWIDGPASIEACPPVSFGNVPYIARLVGRISRAGTSRRLYAVTAAAPAGVSSSPTAAPQVEITTGSNTQVKLIDAANSQIQTTIGGVAGNNFFTLAANPDIFGGYTGGDRFDWTVPRFKGATIISDAMAGYRRDKVQGRIINGGGALASAIWESGDRITLHITGSSAVAGAFNHALTGFSCTITFTIDWTTGGSVIGTPQISGAYWGATATAASSWDTAQAARMSIGSLTNTSFQINVYDSNSGGAITLSISAAVSGRGPGMSISGNTYNGNVSILVVGGRR